MLQIGDIAPLFSLPDADMESFDLEAERGVHHIVLLFYPRDKTPGCTRVIADLSDHEDEFANCDTIVVGISPDDCLTHAEFIDEQGLSVRLLSDEDREVCRLYGVVQHRETDGVPRDNVVKTTFIIDKQGIIRHVLNDISSPLTHAHVTEVLGLVKQL